MKTLFVIILAMLLLLVGCSSNTKSTPADSAEPTIVTTESIEANATPSESISVDVSEPTVSLNDQEFNLAAFVEQVLFDTKKEPKMNIRIGNEDFYIDINDAMEIKDALNIQSWEPVSKASIPYGTIESPISLHNGNHPASEIIIDTEHNYVFVTVYDTNGQQGVDNVRQYPFSLGASVVKDIQALAEELKAGAK